MLVCVIRLRLRLAVFFIHTCNECKRVVPVLKLNLTYSLLADFGLSSRLGQVYNLLSAAAFRVFNEMPDRDLCSCS